MTRFVIVVDTQADFMGAGGALAVPGAEALAEPMQAWLGRLVPEETAGVLFTYDSHEADRYGDSAEARLFPPHCLRGTPGWENVLDAAGLAPEIARYRLEKDVFDMWAEPDSEVEDMRTGALHPRDAFFGGLLSRGVSEVTVIGVAADYCVLWAVAGLVARGFSVRVPRGLTRGIVRQIDAVAAEEFGDGALSVDDEA